VPFRHEIKNGAQLTVRDGQIAAFMNEGQVADYFGPGCTRWKRPICRC
jgi:membrane protease subunit (stomatin/prohibitin family)